VKLNVHLVSHTHDDVGWLKTVDQYYYGANNSIQHAGVQYILDSVVSSLVQNKERKFIYVEIAFFKRWWDQQNDEMKNTVKSLVKGKQLEFVNGGWCMNDEATTHYNAIIDQMTLGLRFINETFGPEARPTVAWHIDPFGHSAEQASLFSMMSFDGFFFGRIDEEDKQKRLKEKRMEMVWRGSRNFEALTQIFTGELYNGYNPPGGFCFDEFCSDQPIMDDQRLFDVNVKERVNAFVAEVCDQATHFKTNNVILTMGSDFMYENANLWYKNLDKLIKYVNEDGRVHVFYSTPSIYLKALYDAGQVWGVKTDDFFPYAHCAHCYWTGFYTSRPTLKGYVRQNNNLLQVCKQMEAIDGQFLGNPSSLKLRLAMGVSQHHDAVSGTEKQHVTYDYEKRLSIGASICQSLMSKFMGGRSLVHGGGTAEPLKFTFCNLLNVSVCPITEKGTSFAVNMYNGIGRPRSSYVKFPVSFTNLEVFSADGSILESQIVPVSKETAAVRGGRGSAGYELIFKFDAPGLGFNTSFVQKQNSAKLHFSKVTPLLDYEKAVGFIENEIYRLDFDAMSGRLSRILRKDIGLSLDIDQQFFWYNASSGNSESRQTSGAYIFRPNKTKPYQICPNNIAKLEFVKGKLVQEARQKFGPIVSQVIRLRAGEPFAEFEYTVGPIPVEDGLGKEVVTKFDSKMKTNKLFYTDANGREIKERIRNYRKTWDYKVTEPVSGNYYPVNSRIFIKDSSAQLTVMTDRSHGGTSIQDGSLELMLHRRLLHDDFLGVGEALNEPGLDGKGLIVRGIQRVLLSRPDEAAKLHRSLGEKILISPLVSFTNREGSLKDWLKKYKPSYTALERALPSNVHLLTMETIAEKRILMRFEHIFAKNEDTSLSKPATILLNGLFAEFEVTDFIELNLAANQFAAEKRPLHWKTDSFTSGRQENKCIQRVGSKLVVVIGPMQICTFECETKKK